MWCVGCGQELREGLRFCTSCGRAVTAEASPSVISAPAPAPATIIEEVPVVGGQWSAPSGDPSSELPRTPARQPRRILTIAVVAGALAVVGVGVAVLSGGSDSSGGSQLPSALSGQPDEGASFDVDGQVSVLGSLNGKVVISIYGSDGDSEIAAYDPTTGKRVWRHDGTSANIVDGHVVLVDIDEVVRLGANGKPDGKSIRLDQEGASLFVRGDLAVASSGDEESLIDLSNWKVLTKGQFQVSSSGSAVYEVDVAGGGDSIYRVRALDASTGKPIGERFEVKDSVDLDVLDDGRLAVLKDGKIRLYDLSGKDLGRQNAPDSAFVIYSQGDLLVADDFSSATVFRVTKNGLEELNGDVESLDNFFEVGGSTWFASGGDRTTMYRVNGSDLEEVLDFRGSIRDVTASGVYAINRDEVEFFRLPGDGQSIWSLDVSEESGVRAIDGALAITEYDSISDETNVTIYR